MLLAGQRRRGQASTRSKSAETNARSGDITTNDLEERRVDLPRATYAEALTKVAGYQPTRALGRVTWNVPGALPERMSARW